MDAQPNRNNRRRRGRKGPNKKPAIKVEPVIALARRPDSPRLEKPTRRMKAASAKPRTEREEPVSGPRASLEEAPKKRREARIVQRKEDEIDDNERNRRRLLSRYMQAEGRAAITREADTYFQGGFQFPREQEVQLKLLEHFDEARAAEALATLSELIDEEAPLQLPIFRQRVRRIEDHADDVALRETAAQLRRRLPA
jgi:hypothetical protein